MIYRIDFITGSLGKERLDSWLCAGGHEVSQVATVEVGLGMNIMLLHIDLKGYGDIEAPTRMYKDT